MADFGGSDPPPDRNGGKGREEVKKNGSEGEGKSQTEVFLPPDIGASGSRFVQKSSQEVKDESSEPTGSESGDSGAKSIQNPNTGMKNKNQNRQRNREQMGHVGKKPEPFIAAMAQNFTGDQTGVHKAEKPQKQQTAESNDPESHLNKEDTKAKAASYKQESFRPESKDGKGTPGSQAVRVGAKNNQEHLHREQRPEKMYSKQNREGTDDHEAKVSHVSVTGKQSDKGEHGSPLSESFCVVRDEDIPIVVKTITGKEITINVRLSDTIEKVKVKIEDMNGIAPDDQRLMYDGMKLLEGNTLLHYSINKNSTIHLLVKLEKGGEHNSQGSKNTEKQKTEVVSADTSAIKLEESNDGSLENVVDKHKVVIDGQMAKSSNISTCPLQDSRGSPNEKEEEGKKVEDQPADSKSLTALKSEITEKHQDFSRKDNVDNAAFIGKLVECNEHKVDDKDKDDLKDKKENMQPTDQASVTHEDSIQKTAEDKGGTKHDDSAGHENGSKDSKTSGKQKVEAAPADTCVNKVEPSDESIEKDDDYPRHFKNNLSDVEEKTEEQIGEKSQRTDDDTQPESGSPLSRSSSIENIAEEDQGENVDESYCSVEFEVKSITLSQNDCRKELKYDTESDKQNGKALTDVFNKAKTQDIEDEDENRQDTQRFNNKESGKSEPASSVPYRYTLRQVDNEYVLLVNNIIPVNVPELNGKSNVSVTEDFIRINGKLEYLIKNEGGKIILTKLEEAQVGDVSKEIQKLSPSPVARHDHGEEEITSDSKVKTAKATKIRASTPKMDELMNMQADEKSQSDKCSQPVASINTDNSHMNSDEGAKLDLDLEAVTSLMGGIKLEDRMSEEPRQQEYNNRQLFSTSKPVKTDECEIAGKPPKAAPRKKHQGHPEKKKYLVTITLFYSREINKELVDHKKDLQYELEDLETYMKWEFVLFNTGTFKTKVKAFKLSHSVDLTCEGDQLVINLGSMQSEPDIETAVSSAVQHILSGTGNLTTTSVPLSEDSLEIFFGNIRKSAMGQLSEILAIYEKDDKLIYLTYNKSQEKVALALVESSFALLTKERRNKQPTETFQVGFIFRSLLEREEFIERKTKTFPNLDFRSKVLEEQDIVLITLSGDKNEIKRFVIWIEEEYIKKYGISNVSYKNANMKNLDEHGQSEWIEEWVKEKLRLEDDIKYDLNPVARTVWICSDKSQSRADEISYNIRKCLEKGIMLEDSIPYSGILNSKQEAELLIKKVNQEHKRFIGVSVTDTHIIVEGLEQYVPNMKSVIEKELTEAKKTTTTIEMGLGARPKTKNVKTVFEVPDRQMYAYLKGSNVLLDLERSCKVHAALLTEGNKLVMHVEGEPNNVSKFEKEIQKFGENITSDVITLEGQAMSFLDIRLQNISVQSQANLLLESLDKTTNSKDDSISQEEFLACALKDAAKVSWDYPDGHRVICTNMYVRCPWQNLLVIPLFGSSATEISRCLTETCVFLPVQEKGAPKDKHSMSDLLDKALAVVKQKSIHYISVYVEETQSWPKISHVKPILSTLKRWLEQESLVPTVIMFACLGDQTYKECVGICRQALINIPFTQHHTYQEKIRYIGGNTETLAVEVIKEQIVNVTADVIVNTTGKDLNLKAGAVSASLLKSAGSEMQEDLQKKKPFGINHGELVRTDPFKLTGCQHVLHGSVCHYTDIRDLQKLEDFVIRCFMKADELKCRSIALPAIGTGNLGYPKNGVAKAMFHSVQRYLEQRRRDKSHLLTIRFVVYHMDTDTCKEFQMQKLIWNCRNTVGPISYQLDIGRIAKPKTETLIFLWDKSKMNYASFTTNPLLKVCGREVREVFRRHRESHEKYNMLQTIGGDISVSEIYHTPCDNTLDNIHQAIFDSLTYADNRRKRSTSVAFDNHLMEPYNEQIAEKFLQAVENFSADTKTLQNVVMLVETDQQLKKFIGPFLNRKMAASAGQECRQVHLFGHKDEVVQAKGILQKYYKIVKENTVERIPVFEEFKSKNVSGSFGDIEEPCEQMIDRGHQSLLTGPEKLQGSTEVLIPDSRFDKYIQVQNIPRNYTRKGLADSLLKIPVKQAKLIFCDNKTTALLVCHTVSDAARLDGYSALQPFTLQKVRAKSLSRVQKRVDASFVNETKENNKFADFIRELSDADIQVMTHKPFVLEAPTTYQLEFVNMTVEKYRNSCRKDSEFEDIEKIENVTETEWDVVRHSEKYSTLKGKCNVISFLDGSIIVDSISPEDEDLQAFKNYIETLKKMEFFERSTKEYKAEEITEWIGSINEALEYDCCTFLKEKRKIVVACKRYDDIIRFKHLFAMKSGELKPTARGRKRNVNDADEEFSSLPNEQTEVQHYRGVSHDSADFSWKNDAKQLQTYKTIEGIQVCVYEANILKVPVDCIVNAANERLQHGGGVAAVIARAAGPQMKKADDKFLKDHVKLPVGMACKTAAGNLKYSFVIHTVGPEWSYYHPHTYEDVKRCEQDLYKAIYSSFMVAESNNAASVALPAISSAIFHVPEELCVYQYAKATVDYSRKSVGAASRLKEIHFIDKNRDIVRKIQKMFDCWLMDKMVPQYDSSKFVKKDRGNQSDFRSSRGRHGWQNVSLSQASSKGDDLSAQVELPTPLFYESGWNSYTFLFCGTEKQSLLLNQGDIFKIRASAIVITINEKGIPGNIGSTLKSHIHEYRRAYTQNVSSKVMQKHVGDAFLTDGYSCGYQYIIHAVCSRSTRSSLFHDRKSKLREAYSNIFDLCKRNDGIDSVVMTLIEIDTGKDEEIKMCSEAFLESYLQYCLATGLHTSSTLKVHLVCNDEHVADVTKSVLSTYVLRKKAEMEEQKDELPSNNSETVRKTKEQVPDDSETEDCVICMDSVNDPQTLECGHTFCKDCIDEQFKFKQACPTCGKVIGVITGDQPEGKMEVDYKKYSYCCGYNGYGQIVITYSFPDGKQSDNHPHPGTWYKGITRVAYLPNNDQGKQVRDMLRIAFDRKLVFTIGSSRTTGKEGVITWNDIHHKTDPRPHTQFGYPDPKYLDRVTDELSAKGITVKDIKKKQVQ